jgi:ribonuclease BN (tRNA processing enzyme)
VRLEFFGTRGFVSESSRFHRGHSAILVEAGGFRLLCDFGQNRNGLLRTIRPDAIVISHAHPDHGGGLAEGTDVPVYASSVTHRIQQDLPYANRRVLAAGRPARIGPFRVAAYPVIHSVRCPCMAVRLTAEGRTLVYSGDLVAFPRPEKVLPGADVYIGDGSTLSGTLVRRHPSGALIGHTSIRAQLGWLAKAGVPRAIFTHFGRGPIRMGERALASALGELAAMRAPGCEVTAARDGLAVDLRA